MPENKILITGANGFIGTRLVAYLNNKGFDIRVLSRNPSHIYESIRCDFLKDKIPSNALHSVDIVFHLAGFAHDFQVTSKASKMYGTINVDATVQLAKLAVQNNVKTFVFVSSVKAGGKPKSTKCMTEDDQFIPNDPYGKSKREAELKLLEIGQNSEMSIIIVRPSLVYGNGMKGNLNLMLSGIKNGWFPPLPNINNRRSMIHVDDLVEALIMVSNNNNLNGEIFILTDGQPYSTREIYEAMCKSLGKKIPKWSIPLWVFKMISKISRRISYRIDKLLGDEWYSSKKIESIGYKAKRSFTNLNQK